MPAYPDIIGTFLRIFSGVLLEQVHHLDETVEQVTALATAAGPLERDMIVALQSFDRLKQEFEALGSALARCAELANGMPRPTDSHTHFGDQVISAITVAGLRDRLWQRLEDDMAAIVAAQTPEVRSPEMDYDVIF